MRINFLYVLLLFFYCTEIFSQSDYFIKYKNEVTPEQINSLILSGKLTGSVPQSLRKSVSPKFKSLAPKEDDALSRIYKITFPFELTESDIRSISSAPEVEYFQKSVLYKVDVIPNDKLIQEQWALHKIKAFPAWDITRGNDSVVVGVIDTGIDFYHPDLKNNIYINPGEDINNNGLFDTSDNNGIDDDRNGFTDDIIGWDFTDRAGFPFDSSGGDYLRWDNIPMDEYGHGTYVAGIIAAESDNNEGIAGAAPGIKVLNLRAFDPAGYGEEDDVAAAIIYAVKCGVKVINMSFGDNSFSYVLRDILKYAHDKGVVLVGSSGNSSSDQPHYPSAFNEVISTGSSTQEDYISSFSNFGSTIDLVAPGSEILTTALDGHYSTISGTSASAPFASAAAALLLCRNNFSPAEITQILKSTSDQINRSGWDLKSGAGRLNMERALKIAAPAEIKFISPLQDYASNADSLEIVASILSPYFQNYELFLGTGLNPEKWESLTTGKFQFEQKKIFTLDIRNLKDSVYCLRLVISQTNGRTMEERVNFYVNRAPALMSLHSLNSFYYGLYPTIVAEVITSKPTVVRMYYRARGMADFSFITLDGFASNNQFVKQHHYGFIPHNSIIPDTEYEVYFESEDFGGLKSILKNDNSFYSVKTDPIPSQMSENAVEFSLPAGQIFKDPVNFTGGIGDEVLIQDNLSTGFPTSLYKYSAGRLTRIDSMKLKYPKAFGDFNKDGRHDLLSAISRTGFIEQQIQAQSSRLTLTFTDSSNAFYPTLAEDLDGNGDYEILSIYHDKLLGIWDVDNSLNAKLRDTLKNFSEEDPLNEFSNSFGFTNAAISDVNADGVKELWMIDRDGDLISYRLSPKGLINGDTIHTDFESDLSLISSGDFDGDGHEEIAVLLQSSEIYSIAPFNLLLVFNLHNNVFNLIYEKYFLDPSEEFRSSFQTAGKSMRFVDLDNDNKSELVLFTFPYSYIISYDAQRGGRIIYYRENINSTSVFSGDLNSNGVPEVAFPDADGIRFLEFTASQKPPVPVNFEGYSLNSASIQLQWSATADKYYIFKGINPADMRLYDSTSKNSYNDSGILNTTFFYQVQCVDPGYPLRYSNKTEIIKVFHHTPAKLSAVNTISTNSVLVEFNSKMSNTIKNLAAFYIKEIGYPNSIALASEYSYVLTFDSLAAGERHLFITGLRDFFGSPVSSDSIKFMVSESGIITKGFYIESFLLIAPNKLELTFNETPESASAANTLNYSFTPDNDILEIAPNPGNPDKLILTTRNVMGSIGKEYRLKISNLRSSEASGSLPLRSASGSVIVITSTAANLNDVYVYPNPARIGNTTSVTFANLTAACEISIFDVSGNKIRFLKENTLNGGIDWDLKDENSRFINSGIYIYRIISVDEFGNQTEEKLGKIAVIK